MATACRSIDWRRAADYLEQIASRTLARRFGWLAEHAGAMVPDDARARLLDLASGSGKAFYGPRSPRPGAIGYQDAWQLTVNVGSEELRESSGLARRRTVVRGR